MQRTLRVTAMLSFVVLALSIPARSAIPTATAGSSKIPKLLNQIKNHAAEANYDVATLDSCRRSPVSWRLYAETLNMIKAHANDLFQDYYELQRLRESATPAQRDAIDKLELLLRGMASSLTNIFEKMHADQSRVDSPEFRNEIHDNWVKINAVYQELCKCTKMRN